MRSSELDQATLVQCTVREGVGIVTLNRPEKRNALNAEMYDQFNTAMRSHQSNPDVNAVLIVGNGPVFCAGGDLQMIDQAKRGIIDADNIDLELFQPGSITKPIVCGVAGACVGEGVAIALASDLVICGVSARFSLPEIAHGIAPVDIPLLAARRLNPLYMLEALLTGDWKDASWADKVGFVNQVVPDEAVWETAFTLARRIAAVPSAPVALVKSLIYQARTPGDAVALRQRGASLRASLRESSRNS